MEPRGLLSLSQEPSKKNYPCPKHCVIFRKIFFLLWGVFIPTANPEALGPPPLADHDCLSKIHNIRSYPPYLEAVSSIPNLRTGHAVVTGIHLTRSLIIKSKKRPVKQRKLSHGSWGFSRDQRWGLSQWQRAAGIPRYHQSMRRADDNGRTGWALIWSLTLHGRVNGY
jgi:hypothetical protein